MVLYVAGSLRVVQEAFDDPDGPVALSLATNTAGALLCFTYMLFR